MDLSGKKRFKIRDFFPGWNLIEYIGLRGFAGAINSLPIAAATRIAEAVGELLFFLLRKRRRIAFDNVEIAFGATLPPQRKREIVRGAFRNLVISLMELFRMQGMLKDAERSFEFEGTEHLDRAFNRSKGVILVISHLGSWEYLAFLPYLRKYPCSVIGRPMRNPYVYRWVQKLRRKTALNHIDKKNAVKEVLRELRANHLVAILIDQWAGTEGLRRRFFGEETSTTSIPVRLSKKTGAALIPAYCLRTSAGRYKISIMPEVAIQGETENDWETQTTDALNRLLEEQIRRNPVQWIWTHRRWKGYNAYHSKAKT